ncbi:MAG: acyl-CoA dehydrogenase, partial [Actinobacteria bacterium]
MDFEYTDEQKAFQQEVRDFLKENYDPDVMDPTREGMAQLVDSPPR